MVKIKMMQWMNKHTGISIAVGLFFGYALHVLYEIRISIHHGWLTNWYFVLTQAAIVLAGAGIAGWVVDLFFTKSEEQAGEID